MTSGEVELFTTQIADTITKAILPLRQELDELRQRIAALETKAAPRREPRSEDLP